MKRTLAAIFTLFLALACSGPAMAAEQDVRGGKDHPLLSRMPDFRLSEYKDTEFNSHRFIGRDKKQVSIEGHKYYLEYKLNKGAAEPGELKIRRNVQDALKKIGGKVVFDDNFNRDLHHRAPEGWPGDMGRGPFLQQHVPAEYRGKGNDETGNHGRCSSHGQ